MDFYQEPEENRLHTIINWIVDIIVVIAFASYLVFMFGSRVEIYGSSMNPILQSGDVVLMNRLSYDLGEPERFDIAIFSVGDSGYNLKRIIGLPGETIQIKNNLIYINDEPLITDASLATVTIAGAAVYPIELGADEYFLLGDNRESSEDSRFSGIGNVKRNQIEGKAWLKFQPFSEIGFLDVSGGNE